MVKGSISRYLVSAALGGGALLIALGMLLWAKNHAQAFEPAVLPHPQQAVTTDTREPSEAKIADDLFARYSVPAKQPRSITIKSIGVKALVQRMGLTKEGNIAAPTNVFFAGWYTGSVLPGQKGLSIIDGHVSGKTTDGVFKKLANVTSGDIVTVEFGDRTTKMFTVDEVRKVPLAEASRTLFTRRSDGAQLNLITCGGTYDRNDKTFTQRVIMVTHLQG